MNISEFRVSRLRVFAILLPVLFIRPAFLMAYTETQTDWAGGPGIWGPVADWGNRFFAEEHVLWHRTAGKIVLSPVTEHLVGSGLNRTINVVTADIDGDGYIDLVSTGYWNTNTRLYWYENVDGLGAEWQGHTIEGYLADPLWTVADDINGDGYMDVVVSDRYSGVHWYENDGGTGDNWIKREIYTIDGFAYCTSTGDIDGDGDTDVVLSNGMWYENVDGSGTQWSEHSYGGQWARGIDVADIDGDGDLDIAEAYFYTENNVMWYENDGLGSFQPHLIDEDLFRASSVFCADIDQDGRMDVVAGSAKNGQGIVWYKNSAWADGLWVKHLVSPGFCKTVWCDDMNSDGHPDIIGAPSGDKVGCWMNQDGAGLEWDYITLAYDFSDPVSVTVNDLNGDGCRDVAGVSSNRMEICWWDLADTSHVGTLESSVLGVSSDPSWLYFLYSSFTPEGTRVGCQFRVSDDPNNMGTWSDTLWMPDSLSGLIPPGKDYIQYRVIMTTRSVNQVPMLQELSLEWEEYTSAGSQWNDGDCFSTINPSRNGATVDMDLVQSETVDIRAYDISGRLVLSISRSFSPGSHAVDLELPCPGVYAIRIRAGNSQFSMLQTVLY